MLYGFFTSLCLFCTEELDFRQLECTNIYVYFPNSARCAYALIFGVKMSLENDFRNAAQDIHDLAERPTDRELLQLYALYKQAITGDVTGKRPGMLDIKGRKKYDSWKSLKGMSKEQSMQEYIDLVKDLTS